MRFNTMTLELSEKYAKLQPLQDEIKASVGQKLDASMDELRMVRDELALKAHLLGMEARQQWEETEPLWARLSSKLEMVKHESGEALDRLASAADELKNDLAERYHRLRKDS
ncbi:MAG: M2 family metallopeptidase [Halothiobacillaceae bacterium]|nr:M2 family metallopeptidase [Halothiobacillaceae bacterium]